MNWVLYMIFSFQLFVLYPGSFKWVVIFTLSLYSPSKLDFSFLFASFMAKNDENP